MPPVPEHSPSRRSVLVIAALLVVVGGYVATFFAVGGQHVAREGIGYYSGLTDALLSGQLYLKTAPDPRLALLANPYLSYQGIPRMHDATYFHGHYYLYFGVAPVIVLFAPWRLLTGTFLTEGAAGVVFGLIGCAVGLLILRRWLTLLRHRPGNGWIALGILLWGFGNFGFVLSQSADFYAVPILCAFACVMTALYAVQRAVLATTPGPSAGWLALASGAWGLAVASRPHYVFSLPLLTLPLGWLLLRDKAQWAQASRGRLVFATGLPAAIIGALLAWYNYARFGSITEFGFRYQFTGGDQRFIQMWNPGLILQNLMAYTLPDGIRIVYFPFDLPAPLVVGIFAWSPFAVLGLGFPLVLLSRRLRLAPAWVIVGGCALGTALIHLFALSILPIGADRYAVDFDPELILAGMGLALAGWDLGADRPSRGRRMGRWIIGLLATVSVLKCSLLAMERSASESFKRDAAEIFNLPTAAVQAFFGGARGPIKLQLSLDHLSPMRPTAVVATGGDVDAVFVQQTAPGRLRFGFTHLGNEPTFGPGFSIDPTLPHTVIVDMGSLYPPEEHSFFRGWNPKIVAAIHHRVLVSVDGRPVFSEHSNFYPSDPFHVTIGTARVGGLAPLPGPVTKVSHLPIPTEAQFVNEGWHGSVRLHFKFPAFSYTRTEPLLSSGSTDASDMIFVTYLGRGLARFGHDSLGAGAVESAPVAFDPATEHTLDVGLGSLEAAPGSVPPSAPGLRLRFDGQWLIMTPRASHPSEAYQVTFGYNSGHMGSAQEAFSGPYLTAEHIPDLKATGLPVEGSGPLEVTLKFVPMPPGLTEPLVVTGITGKGDVVFVHFVDPTHLYLGIDHWSVGSAQSAPFVFSPDRVYTLKVTSAAFLPPAGDPAWGSVPRPVQDAALARIQVSLNGVPVVTGPWPGYPATADHIAVGVNPIGGSTSGPVFSGKIIAVRRIGLNPVP